MGIIAVLQTTGELPTLPTSRSIPVLGILLTARRAVRGKAGKERAKAKAKVSHSSIGLVQVLWAAVEADTASRAPGGPTPETIRFSGGRAVGRIHGLAV